MDLIHEKEELEHKVADLEAAAREWAQKFVLTTDNQKQMQSNYSSMMTNLKQQYKCKFDDPILHSLNMFSSQSLS
jgi:hypothetical protein